jgi:peptidoglycan/LPS O-acetylase OafA/YrhL
VAILLVLLFHAGLPGMAGGFAGVDVFFVISGFVITGMLLREHNATGRVDIVAFYARRARRILPAATATLLGTLVVSWLVLAPLALPGLAADAASVVLFGGNVRFAYEASDYFAAAAAPSPLLQYWSLGVEEQFYLVWPALLILAWRVRPAQRSLAVTTVFVLAASVVAALVLTDTSPQWAFYLLPARAWQFATGAVLAMTVAAHARVPDRIRAVAGWLGLGAIAVALLTLGPDTPYPGVAALLPTLGAAGVILAASGPRSPGVLLCTPPLRGLGRISYSLYLVHWPILTLPAAGLAIGAELPLIERMFLVAVSIALAWVSWRWIEEPFRHGRFVMPPRRVFAVAGATAGLLLVVVVGVNAAATRLLDGVGSGSASDSVPAANVSVDTTQPDGDATAGDATSGEDGVIGADTPPPDLVAEIAESSAAEAATTPPSTPASTGTPHPAPTAWPTRLPVGLRPSLAQARDDQGPLLHDGCELGYPGTVPPSCVYGDPHGAITVALVGDSHASQWFPAFQRIAIQHHWRVVPLVKLSCRFFDLPMFSRVLKREYTECAAWRIRVVSRLQTLRPDLVVVALARGPEMLNDSDNDPRVQGLALASFLRRLPAPAAILVDTPESYYDVPVCLSGNAADIRRCQTPRRAAFGWRYRILEQTAARATGAKVVDLSAATCPRDPCPVVVDGMLVYRDSHHLTATFAASLAPTLYAALPVLGAPVPASADPQDLLLARRPPTDGAIEPR